ncbi:MAG TPA: nitrate- and nitrite sensing domain-containing protein [Actinoplanes sp.]|nr:nitrate- and nitrite sensing domain-containing protein [Actinoplanes sp.]
MHLGRLRVPAKLALLLAVPLLGVVALSVPLVHGHVNDARDARRAADAVALAGDVGDALQALQQERLLAVGLLGGQTSSAELVVQTATVQQHLAQLRNAGAAVPDDLQRALHRAARLDATRAAVLARTARADVVVADYTAVITPIIDALAPAERADLATTTGRQLYALDTVLRSADLVGQAAGLLTSAVAARDAARLAPVSTKLIELQAVVTRAEPYFTAEQYADFQRTRTAFSTRIGANFTTLAATDADRAMAGLKLETLYPELQSALVLDGFLQQRITTDVDAGVTQQRRDATRAAYVVGGLSLLLLVLAFGFGVLVARAVVRPLHRLTAATDRIARTAEAELSQVDDDTDPAPPVHLETVDVSAADEIGDLARAFHRVQATTAQLIERQAAARRNVAQMFGHVGRRTQNLAGRQLAIIDQLEGRETDTDRLRELYRLDHLSNRLRRNAGSLVVLSGGAGTDDHLAPMHLADVVRLALGEIEDYTRVDIEVPEQLTVLPAVIADLTLLLAELMENATSFSPPHTRVTVTAGLTGDGARIEVIDHGLGLPPERLAEQNARLARRERLDLAPSGVLGLFVVGRLARRHGLAVQLGDTPDGGVTVRIDLQAAHLLAQTEMPVAEGAPDAQASPLTQAGPGVRAIDAGGTTSRNTGVAVRLTSDGGLPYDAALLGEATRTLQTGRPWNAFVPAQASAPALESAPAASRPALEAGPSANPQPVAGSAATPRPLARRTPGATLPASAPEPQAPPAAPARPMDPDEVRDLIEQFENGVALALREADSSQPEGHEQ